LSWMTETLDFSLWQRRNLLKWYLLIFPGAKKRPARRADNLAVIYEPNVWKCGSFNFSQT
jgi:hypothetical protein